MTEDVRKRAINKLIPKCPICRASNSLEIGERNIIFCSNCNSKWLRTSGITMKLLESDDKDLVGKHMEFDDWNKIAVKGKEGLVIESQKKSSAGALKDKFIRAYTKQVYLKRFNYIMAFIGLVFGIYFLREGSYLLSALMFLGMLAYLYRATTMGTQKRRMTRAERRRRERK